MSPKTARGIHLAMMILWGVIMVVIWFVPQAWLIKFLVLVSIYANFVGHWSGYSAERPTETIGEEQQGQ